VELLLEHGAELEACDDNGQTPLLAAVIDGAEAVVRTLLREGADVDRTDDDGQVRKRSFVQF
jgi:ankyrin repeat protein